MNYSTLPAGNRPVTSYSVNLNRCMSLPHIKGDRELREIFVSNEDKMYALVSETCHCCNEFLFRRHSGRRFSHRETHISYITKYKPESNSWENISIFDKLDLRQEFCIVAKDNFIYFIGGVERYGYKCKFLTDVHRYDLSRNQWDKVADIQEPKMSPCGAVVNGKIVIAGRITQGNGMSETCQCEVYNETTNEWQFIASFNITPYACPKLLSVDGTLYAVGIVMLTRSYRSPDPIIQCYNPDKNEWHRKTEIPFGEFLPSANAYSVRIFKRFLLDRQLKSPVAILKSNAETRLMDGTSDAMPLAPGSSVECDQPLTEEPVDIGIAPAPARPTQRKCCFIM